MTIFLLPIATVFELIKRPILWLLYLFAYPFRNWARAHKDTLTGFFLWCALDDSIVADNKARGLPETEYCQYGKRSAWIEYLFPYDFARSFYWGAWRNNGINFMAVTEHLIGGLKETVSHKGFGRFTSFYEVRLFACGWKLPYLEWWLSPTFRVQCGWISCGRFQVQARTYP